MNKTKSIAFLTLGRGINAIINILFLPYMARALDYNDYATYGQVLLVIEIFTIIFSLANNQYLYVLLSNLKVYNKRNIIFNSLLLNSVLAIIAILLIQISGNSISKIFNNPDLTNYLKLYSIIIFPTLIQTTLNYVLYFFNRIKHALTIQIIFNLIKTAGVIVGVQYFQSLNMVFIFMLCSGWLIFLLYLYKFPIKIFLGKLNTFVLKKLLTSGTTIGLSAIAGILMIRTDGTLVSSMLTQKDYAIYRMGAIEIPLLILFFSSVSTVILPNIVKLYQQNNFTEIIRLKRKVSTSIALAIFPSLIFILFFAKSFISFYLGKQYIESTSVFLIYNLAVFIRINDYKDILTASNNTKIILTIEIIALIINFALCYLLVIKLGIVGAALSTLIAITFKASTLLSLSLKKIQTNLFSFFDLKSLLSIILISCIFCVLIYLTLDFSHLIYLILIYSIYMVLTYFTLIKLNLIKKELLLSIVDQLFNNSKLKKLFKINR